jgi:hypothetical protein
MYRTTGRYYTRMARASSLTDEPNLATHKRTLGGALNTELQMILVTIAPLNFVMQL